MKKTTIALTLSVFLMFSCKKDFPDQRDSPAGSAQNSETMSSPNIILVVDDDVGYEAPSFDGGGSYQTPYMDSLAGSGTRFTLCHSQCLCSPSRTMLMTGKYCYRNYTRWGHLELTEKTIANLLHDAGYATCATGKWQFDGGDIALSTFGFDRYSVNDPFTSSDSSDDESVNRYKNPVVYEDGNYIDPSQMIGKYGDDVFSDYGIQFMDSVSALPFDQRPPFFWYFGMTSCHAPFGPTPDDPAFVNWNPNHKSVTSYFPSMMNYMDKKIGDIAHAIERLGITGNTVVLILGDNGTPPKIYSLFNGIPVQGGKGSTNERGTHVPLTVSGLGVSNNVANNLIDFTDILPTIADITHVARPEDAPDGVSFYQTLLGQPGPLRPWIYSYYPRGTDASGLPIKWIQDSTYKLYDARGSQPQKFYNIKTDPEETTKLKTKSLTKEEKMIKDSFALVLSRMHN